MFYLHIDYKIHQIILNYYNSHLSVRPFTAEIALNNQKRIIRYISWCKIMEKPKYGLEANDRRYTVKELISM